MKYERIIIISASVVAFLRTSFCFYYSLTMVSLIVNYWSLFCFLNCEAFTNYGENLLQDVWNHWSKLHTQFNFALIITNASINDSLMRNSKSYSFNRYVFIQRLRSHYFDQLSLTMLLAKKEKLSLIILVSWLLALQVTQLAVTNLLNYN